MVQMSWEKGPSSLRSENMHQPQVQTPSSSRKEGTSIGKLPWHQILLTSPSAGLAQVGVRGDPPAEGVGRGKHSPGATL